MSNNQPTIEEFALKNALEFFLSEIPTDIPLDEVCDRMRDEDSDVLVYHPFEYWDVESVINGIDELALSLENQYREIIEIHEKGK